MASETEERAALACEVYTATLSLCESFEEQHIGADLAYLMGAILIPGGAGCEWPGDRPLVELLRGHFEAGHRVWSYITLTPPEADIILVPAPEPVIVIMDAGRHRVLIETPEGQRLARPPVDPGQLQWFEPRLIRPAAISYRDNTRARLGLDLFMAEARRYSGGRIELLDGTLLTA
jgi:hypothetical protein